MSLTLVSAPPALNLAAIPAQFKFQTNNLYQSTGEFSRYRLTLTAVPAPGQHMLFFVDGLSIVINFTNNPDNSGYQIEVPLSLPTLADWVSNTLVPGLQANYYLSKWFTITGLSVIGGNEVVEFKAKEKSTAYNIQFSTDSSIVGALYVSGAFAQMRPNFSSYFELFIAKHLSNDFAQINAYQTHSNAESTLPVHNILTADYAGSALPDYGSNAIKNISSAIIKYYLRYAEAYGEPKLIQKISQTGTYYALNGGYGKTKAALQSFFADVQSGKTLLHNPVAFTVGTNHGHWLNYLHYNDAQHFKVYATINYTDGTSQQVTLFYQTSGVQKPSLFAIPCGVNIISAVASLTKEIYSYTVWVGNSNTPTNKYSQEVTHVVDTRPQLDQSVFIFKNSFGVFEAVRCTGTVAESTVIAKENASRWLPPGYQVTEAASITHSQTEQRQWQINSGHKSKTEMRHFVEFLLSPSVYRVASGYFEPVTIKAEEAQLAASRSGRLNNVTFTAVADKADGHV